MPENLPNWHPIIVHFAIGLLFTSALSFALGSVLARRPAKAALTTAARLDLSLGFDASFAAFATDWYAYNRVDHDAQSHVDMAIHMKWSFATVVLFLIASSVGDAPRAQGSRAS